MPMQAAFFIFFSRAGLPPWGAISCSAGATSPPVQQRLWLLGCTVLFFWLFVPLFFCAVCRAFGVGVTIGSALISSALFLLSWPAAVLLVAVTARRGGVPDPMEVLRSGIVIPLLLLSLGHPILRARRA